MKALLLSVSLAAMALPQLGWAQTAAPDCKAKAGKPRVFVRGSTPLRRGPGLNYPVSSFLEKGGCKGFVEISADEKWALVDAAGDVGWVPVTRLSRASAARLKAGDVPKSKPVVGSGQTRSKIRVRRQAMLLESPNTEAGPRRVLPVDLEVVAISVTESGNWVEIRDDRGQTGWVLASNLEGSLADVPLSDASIVESNVPTSSGALGVSTRPVRLGRRGVGVALTAAVYAGAVNPIHRLDSNANQGRRRYTLSAFAPAAAIDVEMTDLGPLSLRLGYAFALVAGVTPDGANQGASGTQHDASLRLGLPLGAGPVLVTPEIGYALSSFDFDPILPDQPAFVTVVSSTAHLLSLGSRFQLFASERLMIELDGAFLLGATQERPRDLGANGLTVGGSGSIGLQYFMSELLGVSVRYGGTVRRVSYSGASFLDPSLTEANTLDASHGLMLGLSFLLAG